MSRRVSPTVGIGFWLFTHLIRPDLLTKARRKDVAFVRQHGRPIAGRGLLKTHACAQIFDFVAMCQQPVEDQGGPGTDADCRACRRLLRRAGAA